MTSPTVCRCSPLSWLCLILFACPGFAQEQPQPPAGLRFNSFGRAMHGRLQPGGWCVVSATVMNTSERPLTARTVATLSGFPDIQNARTLTIFPKSTESFDLYVQVPKVVELETTKELEVSLYQVNNDGEVLLDVKGVPMRNTLRLQVEQSLNRSFTSLNNEPFEQFPWEWPFKEPYHNYEIVVSSRVLSGNNRSTVGYENLLVPLTRMDWKDVGLMTISDTRFFEDATSVEALNQFINDGGRAWIMLDKIPCHLIQPLLGLGNSCEEVDQVEMNRFSVKSHSAAVSFAEDELLVDKDDPVVFKRVAQVGGIVTHSIDGWPAAISMKIGYGEVLLTTLASAGWLRPGSESDDPQLSTSFRMAPWGLPFALEVHESRLAQPIPESVGYPLELVGNPVLPRTLVGLILLGFIVVLVGAGVVFLRLGELSRLGYVAPLLSAVAGGGLLLGSTWIRRDIPETLSRLQLIQVTQDGRTAMVREQSAVHLDASVAMKLVGNVDGYVITDPTLQSGIKRFDVGDIQNWELSNIAWPPGSWRYQTTQLIETPRLKATGTLDEAGLTINLPSELPTIEDPVIGFAPGVPMIGKLDGQSVTADGRLMAEGDRWIDGTLISDEQRRRIDVYQQFFSGDDRHLPPRNTLFGWSTPWDGARWDYNELTEVGSSLVGIPLRLLRPPVGKTILVPAGLIQLRKDSREAGQTSAYNAKSGKWSTDLSLGIDAHLQFVLPPEVLPFQARELNLELNIKAPHRIVRLVCRSANGEPIEIVALDGPSVPWKGTITDPSILADALDGAVDITLEISERTDIAPGESSSSHVTWAIDAFRASAIGTRLSEAEQLLTQ